MSVFSWMFLIALIDEYRHIVFALLIGIPLCFINPIVGVLAGIITACIVAHHTGD